MGYRGGLGWTAALLLVLVLAIAVAGAPGVGGAAETAPRILSVHMSNKVFAVGPRNTPLMLARRLKRGTKLRVTLSKRGKIVVLAQRRVHGRVVRGECVPRTRRNRRRRKCTVVKTRMTLTRAGRAGKNTIPFSGRAKGIVLSPGAFQFSIRARALEGTQRSDKRVVRFRIVKA